VVFPLWDLIRYDLPLSRGSFHLIECLLCKSLHYITTSISSGRDAERRRATHAGLTAWNELG
jgi:hypothetical protein